MRPPHKLERLTAMSVGALLVANALVLAIGLGATYHLTGCEPARRYEPAG